MYKASELSSWGLALAAAQSIQRRPIGNKQAARNFLFANQKKKNRLYDVPSNASRH